MRIARHLALWLVTSSGLAGTAIAAEPRVDPVGTPITPEQALARAAGRDPGLQAALLDIRSAGIAVLVEDRARKPVLTASLSGQHAEHFRSTTEGLSRNASDGVAGTAAVSTTTDVGTVIDITASLDASWSTTNVDVATVQSVTLGPDTSALIGIDVRQPLLRGAGTLPVLAALREARLAKSDALVARDAVASQLARDVLTAFWDLWYAQEALEVERAAYVVTEKNYADTRTRAEVLKTVPTLDVLRFSAELGTARGRVASAEATVLDRQLALGLMLGIPAAEAVPAAATTSPEAPAVTPDLATLLRTAHETSYTLRQLRSTLAQAKDAARTADDATLVRLDLQGSVSAGMLWTESSSGLFPGGRPAIIAQVGLALELPLGSSSAEARAALAHLRIESAELALARQAEVSANAIARTRAQLEAARNTLRIATDTAQVARALADKEAERLALGTVVPIDVITARQAAREAELGRLRALADLATLAIELDHQVGTLLPRVAGRFFAGKRFALFAKDVPSGPGDGDVR